MHVNGHYQESKKKTKHTEWEKVFVFSLFPIVLPKQVGILLTALVA